MNAVSNTPPPNTILVNTKLPVSKLNNTNKATKASAIMLRVDHELGLNSRRNTRKGDT